MQPRIRVYFEGDDDRALLRELQRQKLLPSEVELADKPAGGASELLGQCLPLVRIGGQAIVLRDFDDLAMERLGPWLEEELGRHRDHGESIDFVPETSPARSFIYAVRSGPWTGRVAAIPVGLPGDGLVAAQGFLRYASDDYVLRLAWDRAPRSQCAPTQQTQD